MRIPGAKETLRSAYDLAEESRFRTTVTVCMIIYFPIDLFDIWCIVAGQQQLVMKAGNEALVKEGGAWAVLKKEMEESQREKRSRPYKRDHGHTKEHKGMEIADSVGSYRRRNYQMSARTLKKTNYVRRRLEDMYIGKVRRVISIFWIA